MYKLEFPLGIIKIMNSWITNEYSDNLKMVHLIDLKELYQNIIDYIKKYDINKTLNSILLDIYDTLSFIDEKVLNTDKLNNKEIKLTNLYKKKRTYSVSSHLKEQPILPFKQKNCHFDILEWSEIEIARQLSLISHFLISKIRVSELFSSRWTKSEKYSNSPHIMKCIDRFNKLSLWIAEEILSYDKAKSRALVIEKFILIAEECRKMNNFNDCVNITTAINIFPIKRLNKAWRRINFENMKLFKNLNDLCSFANNYALLRDETLKANNKPCVPYLGLHLKALAFLEEGPKYLKKGMVNIRKIKEFGEILNEISRNKKIYYDFKPVFILSFLAEPKPENEDYLIELSNKLEPKFILNEVKIEKKRLTSTDNKSLEIAKTFHKIVIMNEDTSKDVNLKDAIKNFFAKK